MGYERHKNDWKNLVFTVPQYMCLGCWGKTCSLLVVVVVFGDSIASICRREQICIKPEETAWSGLFTRSESHVYTSVWVLLCLLTSWISFDVHFFFFFFFIFFLFALLNPIITILNTAYTAYIIYHIHTILTVLTILIAYIANNTTVFKHYYISYASSTQLHRKKLI